MKRISLIFIQYSNSLRTKILTLLLQNASKMKTQRFIHSHGITNEGRKLEEMFSWLAFQGQIVKDSLVKSSRRTIVPFYLTWILIKLVKEWKRFELRWWRNSCDSVQSTGTGIWFSFRLKAIKRSKSRRVYAADLTNVTNLIKRYTKIAHSWIK